MSSRLDERIRELFTEVDAAAPGAPPMPVGKTQSVPLARWLVPAAGVAVAALVIGVLNFLPASEGTETTTVAGAAATTIQGATDTTQASSSTTEGATATTEAMEDPGLPAGVIAALLGACEAWTEQVNAATLTSPESPDQYRAVFDAVEAPTLDLSTSVAEAFAVTDAPGLELTLEAVRRAGQIARDAATAEDPQLALLYDSFLEEMATTGDGLASAGADECLEVSTTLPDAG
ncbi:MAG TPA: hypothetical protein VEB69_15380 [Acidimicrobiia bacterium]|nr:hypothetical protein [Acidimicrobiia bacterium]